MKCERCHEAEATKALSVEIDGQPSTVFVCDACAAKEKSASEKASGAAAPDGSGEMDVAAKQALPSALSDMLLDLAKMLGGEKTGGKPPVFEVRVRDAAGHVLHASSGDLADSSGDGEAPVLRCPGCGMTLDELRDGRRFGCPECYTTFRDEVPEFTRELQFDDRHVGNAPARVVREATLHELSLKLRKAVARQRFKEAEALSERIRALGGDPESPSDGGEESPAP